MDARFLRHIVESAIAYALQQAAGPVRRPAHQEKIGLAIAVVVEEARAGARSNLDAASPQTLRPDRIRLRRESHRYRRRHIDNRTQRQLRERVTPLIAVARTERRSKMLRRDFLETREMFARRGSIALALKRARQAEFRRSMKRI